MRIDVIRYKDLKVRGLKTYKNRSDFQIEQFGVAQLVSFRRNNFIFFKKKYIKYLYFERVNPHSAFSKHITLAN